MLLQGLCHVTLAGLVLAQSTSTFEVASVKPVKVLNGDLYNINLGRISHGTVTLTNTTLSDCLRFAYGFTSDSRISGPDWIRSKEFRFDIIAKGSPEATDDQLLTMLQALLSERFQLALHREQKEFAHYELVAGKNGPKLQESKSDPADYHGSHGRGRIINNHISMHTLAVLLSRFTRTTIMDMTGLKGAFDLKLEWAPDDNSKEAGDTTDGPSLFTAVQEQLGLKLESRKGPVEVLIVDHAEKVPTEN